MMTLGSAGAAKPAYGSLARWDFFICHAHEDKESIARPLYQELISRGHSVWLDETELTVGDSLRRCIDQGLTSCRFGIVVLSKAFFRKNWTQHELDGLVDRQISEGAKVVLPIWHGVDHAEVASHSPSLAGRMAVTTEWGVTPVVDQLVRAFTAAVAAPTAAEGPDESQEAGRESARSRRVRFPLADVRRAHLLADRPDAWEYLLFGDALTRGMAEHGPAWRDHQLRLVRPNGQFIASDELVAHIQRAMTEVAAIVANMARLLTPSATEGAFGPPGHPGDPTAIEHLAQRLTSCYGQCLDWAADMRSIQCSDDFDRLLGLTAGMADQPLDQFRDFIERCTSEFARLPELINAPGDDGITLQLDLTITVDEELMSSYQKELRRLKRRRKL